MPTENRSSNTEMVSNLLPCPFCGEKPQITKHHREDIYSFMHRCPVLGPISWGFREDQQAHVEKWNARAQPAPQPHPEPIAWMVGTAFWWTKEEAERDAAATGLPIVGLGPMSGAAPAEQRQGEPVALPDRKLHVHQGLSHTDAKADGWNACLDEIAKLGPLYTHADPGEVERLRASEDKWYQDSVNLTVERDALRTQLAEANTAAEQLLQARDLARELLTRRDAKLAERDALLDRVVDHANFWHDHPYAEVVEAIVKDYKALSASAEPSVPAPMPAYMEAACDKFDWTPEEALRFYAEGKHFDVVAGRTRILCTGAIASHALKGVDGEYADMKGVDALSASAEPDATS